MWYADSGDPVGEPLTGHTGRVNSVAVGRAGGRDVIVSGGNDNTVRVWDAASGKPVQQPLIAYAGRVTAVAVARIGERGLIVAGGSDNTVRVWDAFTGEMVRTQDALDPTYAVAMDAGHLYFASGTAVCACTLT
jgi:WD40 repeat protein